MLCALCPLCNAIVAVPELHAFYLFISYLHVHLNATCLQVAWSTCTTWPNRCSRVAHLLQWSVVQVAKPGQSRRSRHAAAQQAAQPSESVADGRPLRHNPEQSSADAVPQAAGASSSLAATLLDQVPGDKLAAMLTCLRALFPDAAQSDTWQQLIDSATSCASGLTRRL